MDEDFSKALDQVKSLAEKPETQVVLKLPVIITILLMIAGALFGGFVNNRVEISNLRTDYKVDVATLKSEQANIRAVLTKIETGFDGMSRTVTEIRMDQIRRYNKEKN